MHYSSMHIRRTQLRAAATEQSLSVSRGNLAPWLRPLSKTALRHSSTAVVIDTDGSRSSSAVHSQQIRSRGNLLSESFRSQSGRFQNVSSIRFHNVNSF